jgi:hypothetical protein
MVPVARCGSKFHLAPGALVEALDDEVLDIIGRNLGGRSELRCLGLSVRHGRDNGCRPVACVGAVRWPRRTAARLVGDRLSASGTDPLRSRMPQAPRGYLFRSLISLLVPSQCYSIGLHRPCSMSIRQNAATAKARRVFELQNNASSNWFASRKTKLDSVKAFIALFLTELRAPIKHGGS